MFPLSHYASSCTTLATVEPQGGGFGSVAVLLIVGALIVGLVVLNNKKPEFVAATSGRISAAFKAAVARFKPKA